MSETKGEVLTSTEPGVAVSNDGVAAPSQNNFDNSDVKMLDQNGLDSSGTDVNASGQGGLSEGGKNRKNRMNNRVLVGVLVVTIVVIVGLVIGIVVANLSRNDGGSDEGVEEDSIVKIDYNVLGYVDGEAPSSAVAVQLANQIDDEFQYNPDYLYADAINDYENAILSTDGDLKIECAILFANFVYSNTDDAAEAVKILNSVNETVGDEPTRVEYYNSLMGYYSQLGDEENVQYYKQLISELVPETIVTYEDIYGESANE